MFGISFWFGCSVTALILLVGHWAPWPRKRILCSYVYGVASILAGCAIWLGVLGMWQVLAGVVALACVGGAATVAAYAVDSVLNLIARVRMVDDGSDES